MGPERTKPWIDPFPIAPADNHLERLLSLSAWLHDINMTFYNKAKCLFVSLVVLSATILGCRTTRTNTGGGSTDVKVVRILGFARSSSDYKNWRMLRTGDRIESGCWIQTAEHSMIDIQISRPMLSKENYEINLLNWEDLQEPAANLFRVFESSVLGLEVTQRTESASNRTDNIRVDLRAGRVIGSVIGHGSRCEVKMSAGSIVTKGAIYQATSSGSIAVLWGDVTVVTKADDSSKKSFTVHKGNTSDLATGRMMRIPPSGPGISEGEFPFRSVPDP
ncbi:MAG: FecR protein [Pedosphaera sp.]|nr:FecR protein [Pedosphaera sp.]